MQNPSLIREARAKEVIAGIDISGLLRGTVPIEYWFDDYEPVRAALLNLTARTDLKPALLRPGWKHLFDFLFVVMARSFLESS